MKFMYLFTVLALSCCYALSSQAAVVINEITLNSENDAPSGGDDTTEYFELLSDAGAESLDGLTLLIIEGEGGNKGLIDKALSLDGSSTGSNGLFLWRDSSDVLVPAPDAATEVKVEDFVPDIENGSETFVLVRGFTGATGDDLDTDNDGTLDNPGSLPWSATLDAVGTLDGTAADVVYATQIIPGGVDFTNVSFQTDSLVRLKNTGGWIGVDIDEAVSGFPGPYPFDDTQAVFPDGTPFTPSTDLDFNIRTPGSMNPSLIPEPSSVAILLAAALIAGANRRRA